jgi:hypothetical protein
VAGGRDRVRGLLLADTSAQVETPAGRTHRNRMADRLLREGMAGYADEGLCKMVARANVEAAEHASAMMRAAPPEGAAAALRGRAERTSVGTVIALNVSVWSGRLANCSRRCGDDRREQRVRPAITRRFAGPLAGPAHVALLVVAHARWEDLFQAGDLRGGWTPRAVQAVRDGFPYGL